MKFTMQPARTAPHIATLISLAGISALTMNIFLPSLPTMTAHFGADYAVMQLSVALYLAVSAALQIVIGPLSDRYGRRPVLLWGLSLFCLATVGTLVAPTTEWFLAARMAQAVMAVGLVLSRAVVRDMVPTDQAASMIGYVTMGMSIVPMIGPGIGGVLDQAFGWQANFWLLLGLGVAMLYAVYVDLGETLPADRLGAGQSFRAQIRDYPHLLLSQRFWGYCLASAFASGAFFAYLGGAPFVGTTLFDLDPAMLGFLFGAPALGYFAGNWITGKYAARVGRKHDGACGRYFDHPWNDTFVSDISGGHPNGVGLFRLHDNRGIGQRHGHPQRYCGHAKRASTTCGHCIWSREAPS
jgi:DHA1 family bicyclomycin/chloramphenicol resistance-like MFS transporter